MIQVDGADAVIQVDGADVAITAAIHDGLADERGVLALDFGQLPRQIVGAPSQALADTLNGDNADATAAETLYLVGAQYMHALGRYLADLAGWSWLP